ncbi:uncharacterized protein LOC124311469 isoform X2 [Daphnia pulicaria]|uniref:uncharacterized protein LOC124311469 isoform X2 n=1 Tax=Daphnia pulicaria TaxID=35523 RepID=UPI001EE9E440|nr:uncharacterized protein LOC124311469 isoform X2 [Daphnia pulicaria]
MRRRRGWVRKETKKTRDISRVSISDTATTAAHYLSPSAFFTVLPVRIHGQLWCRAPVGCCIVDGWIDHWCTEVSGYGGY